MKVPTYFLVFLCVSVTSGTRATDGWIYPWCSPIANDRQPPQSRIVYGETTAKGELPYQLQILWYWDLVCGGTLIQVGDTQAVLTTASCINGSDPFFYAVQASDWNLDVYETEQVREVDQVFFPDNYDRSRPYENDIALITLKSPFELDNLTAPIALPPQGLDINPDGTLLASGWGTWYPLLVNYLTCKLQKVEMPQVDRETCQRFYSEYGVQRLGEF